MFLKIKYCLLFLIVLQGMNAQDTMPKFLIGKISANATDLEGINIKNLNSNVSSTTDIAGMFSIVANVGDTLTITSIQFKRLKIELKKEDFNNLLFIIKLENATFQLDEVKIVDYKNINAISLGIVGNNQKKYTPAERRLYTATGGGNQFGTNNAVSVDGILNAISGRTTRLKKEIKVERKEITINKLNNLFEESYFIESLKIPKEYVNGFKYYIVENNELVKSITAKNYTLTKFLMNNLALEYVSTMNLKK
ncbi:MAG: hypothetical protein PHC28_11570 [Flavobacterium sp.]|uniref:hypothetical protein n=1 Tax=Flavobacterium sp. TaxID=239 RepID=UPI002606802B|nr:hypothetical protein [Flavobacterium sp.]MDD5151092.1 hypothetical protein [Flavobacterium sp.]